MNTAFLIDDDEEDQYVFKEAIESVSPQWYCATALNAQAGLNELQSADRLPQIIFLDLNMPVMNGFEALEKIKKHAKLKSLPVGIYSTSNNNSDRKRAMEMGARFFLTKPSNMHLLTKQLQHILNTDFSTVSYLNI